MTTGGSAARGKNWNWPERDKNGEKGLGRGSFDLLIMVSNVEPGTRITPDQASTVMSIARHEI